MVSNRTHAESNIQKPSVVGIYAENGLAGWCKKRGILRIKDKELAEFISTALTDDFGTPIDSVLFTPQPGRPKYKRIGA